MVICLLKYCSWYTKKKYNEVSVVFKQSKLKLNVLDFFVLKVFKKNFFSCPPHGNNMKKEKRLSIE